MSAFPEKAPKAARAKKPRDSKAKPHVPNIVHPRRIREAVKPIPLRESTRDVALIPARIKARMADLIAILGHREFHSLFDPACRAALDRMAMGNAVPTWAAWRAFQIVERAAFRAVRRMRIKTPKPRLLTRGDCVRVTPLSPAEIAAMYEADERDECGHRNCGCQIVPSELPANVVRLRRTA